MSKLKETSVNSSLGDFGLDLLFRPLIGGLLYLIFKKVSTPELELGVMSPLVVNSVIMSGGILVSEFGADALSKMANYNNEALRLYQKALTQPLINGVMFSTVVSVKDRELTLPDFTRRFGEGASVDVFSGLASDPLKSIF